MSKKIAILGSTGSIGKQTLSVIDQLGPQYSVEVLTAGSNYRLLSEQVRKYSPSLAVLSDHRAAEELKYLLRGEGCAVSSGREGQVEAALFPGIDLVVMAQVGFSGFEPFVAALKQGRTVALANKEALVIGGEILKRQGLLDLNRILPLDSEHSAVWQCRGSAATGEIEKIILTASGGPFFGFNSEQLNRVTAAEALKHPNWQMGPKITIDSATMMNKGLEVIEARWLFDLSLEHIEVVVHPQSIIHSMVEFVDGSILAQLSEPDMRLPIQYALTYPVRQKNSLKRFIPFGRELHFHEPDRCNFPCLDLAIAAARQGGTLPACLNAANEVAVSAFIDGRISFKAIAETVEKTMQSHSVTAQPDLEDILHADYTSRIKAEEIAADMTGVE